VTAAILTGEGEGRKNTFRGKGKPFVSPSSGKKEAGVLGLGKGTLRGIEPYQSRRGKRKRAPWD